MGPLAGLKVLDFTENIAGPYCTMILADMGAEVVKIERPGAGDEMRRHPPFVRGESVPFLTLNRGKKSVTLNLKDPRGLEAARCLARRSDVLVENFRPGTLDRLGLGPDALRAEDPRLIVCSISGFGQTGPYRDRGGYDLVAQAMGGLMSVTGEPGRSPAKCGFPVSDLGAGMWGAIGILLAVLVRERSGQGQRVDTSLLEVPVAWSVWHAARYFATGEVPGPLGSAHPGSAPYQAFQGQDGAWLVIGAGPQHLWERLCRLLGVERLLADPRFATNADRVEHRAELEEELAKAFTARPAAAWLEALEAEGIPAGPINPIDRVFADPQVLHREMVLEQEHPVVGRHRLLGIPVKLSLTPGQVRAPAPTLGQHTEEILPALGYSAEELTAFRQEGVTHPKGG